MVLPIQQRFYVAEFPFENVQLLRQKVSFTVQPQTVPICGMKLGGGLFISHVPLRWITMG